VPAPTLPAAANPAPVIPPKFSPKVIAQWSNAGRATPAAAFETLFWAVDAGRPAEAAALVHFEGEDAVALKWVFDSLSPSARSLFGTPEFMFVAVGVVTPVKSPVTGCEIMDEVSTGPDDAIVHYRMADANARGDTRVRTMPLHRTDGAWTLRVSGLGLPERREMWKGRAQSLADEIGKGLAARDESNGKNE
ncbi:MAG: hypothetical protein ABIO94_10545, partial [Opitutaceae bacterium]